MPPYFLRTERLGFRCWRADDSSLAKALWGDPDVTRLIGGPFSEEQVRERLDQEIRIEERDGIQYWPIFLLAGDVHVGCAGLRPHSPRPKTLELGFHIARAHWSRGYATEAARSVIAHAFDDLGIAALFAGHHPHNRDSAKLLAKLGFRYVGDELYLPTGLMHPSYTLDASDVKR